MKKEIKFLFLLILFSSAIFTMYAKGQQDEKVEADASGWTPYYLTDDFKAFVPLEQKTKDELGDVPDEMTVMPVDRVAPKTVRIAVIGAATNPFFDIIKQGVDSAAETLLVHNAKVDWIIPGSSLSSTDVNAIMEALLIKQYDAIATLVYNEGQIPYIEKAVDQGVPVAAFCADSQPNKALFFIGQDLYAAGVTAAHAMAKEIDNKGEVGVITGFFNVTAHELRRNGFLDTIGQEYPDIEIVGQVEAQDQADKARSLATDFMTSNPNLAGIYNIAGGALGTARAVIDEGKKGSVKIIAFDPLPSTIPFIEDGTISAVIGQNPYAEGRDPVIRLFNYLMDGTLPDTRNLYTRDDVVSKETLEEFFESGQKG